MAPSSPDLPTVPAPPTVLEMEGRPTVPWTPPEALLRAGTVSRRPAPSRRRGRLGVALAIAGAVVLGGVLALPVADALLRSQSPADSPAAGLRVGVSPPRSVVVSVPSTEEGGEPVARPAGADTEPVADPEEAAAARRPARGSASPAREPAEPTSHRRVSAERPAGPEAAVASEGVEGLRDDVLELHQLLPDLAAADVQRVVRNQRPRMRRCYDRALRQNGQATDARLTMTVEISPTGRVDHVGFAGDDVADLQGCLQRLASRWRFTPSRGGARVPIPLSFSTRD